MSLLDALLLEGHRDPHDVWIALRTDGVRGSGTPADPYDGGARDAPLISSTTGMGSPGLTFDIMQAIVVTSAPHGYSPNDTVEITGATEGASTSSPFNGERTITVLNAYSFLITLTTTPAVQHGTTDNLTSRRVTPATPAIAARLFWPVAKVTMAVNHDYVDFDVVTIAGVSNNLFNGAFAIMGATPVAGGMRNFFYYRLHKFGTPPVTPPSTFVESGRVTCSKKNYRYDEVMRALPPNSSVRLGPGEFETRGFCPLYFLDGGGKVGYELRPRTRLRGAGIGATTLKLVHAIDYRGATSAVGNLLDTVTCEVSDFTVDANIAVNLNMPGQPIPSGAVFAPVSCGGLELHGRHVRIRRVRVIRYATQSGPECFAITTSPDSGDVVGSQNSVIEDCIVEQPGENNTHENALINLYGSGMPPAAHGGVVRNCYVNCEFTGGKPNEYVGILSISQPGVGLPSDQFKVITRRKHHRVVGNNVVLMNVYTPAAQAHPYLNLRSFEVVDRPSDTELICRIINPPAPVDIDFSQAYIGVQFHGVSAAEGIGLVSEGNSAYNITIPFYVDTWSSWSQIERNNYYSNVLYGAYQNFDAGGSAEEGRKATGGSLTRVSGDLSLAKFVLPFAHGFRVGLAVRISGVFVGAVVAPENTYNGTFVVEAVDNPTTFYYRMKSTPAADADPPSQFPVTIQALWQTWYYVIENNLTDLYRTDDGTPLVPAGVNTFGYNSPPPYVFQQFVIRENIVRHLDHLASTATMLSQETRGISLDSVANAIVEQNIIDVEYPYPIRHVHSKTVRPFNNRTIRGTRVRGKAAEAATPDSELEDLIEDIAMLCL